MLVEHQPQMGRRFPVRSGRRGLPGSNRSILEDAVAVAGLSPWCTTGHAEPGQAQPAYPPTREASPSSCRSGWSVLSSSSRSRRARSWPCTARSRWPRSTARTPRSSSSTASTSTAYHLFHAIRADLLRRLGRTAEAARAYDAALARTRNASEQAFLRRNREALT